MHKFKDENEALLWYVKGVINRRTLEETHKVLHLAFDQVRRRGLISEEHFRVLEHYARRGRVPELEGREYKARLLWDGVAKELKDTLMSKGLIEEKQWWQA